MEESERQEFKRQLINQDFERLVVNLMRAIGSEDAQDSCLKVAELMEKVVEAVQKIPDLVDFDDIVGDSISKIRKNIEFESRDDRSAARVAKKGLMYLAEASCGDPAAAGRAAKRLSDFQSWAREFAR